MNDDTRDILRKNLKNAKNFNPQPRATEIINSINKFQKAKVFAEEDFSQKVEQVKRSDNGLTTILIFLITFVSLILIFPKPEILIFFIILSLIASWVLADYVNSFINYIRAKL